MVFYRSKTKKSRVSKVFPVGVIWAGDVRRPYQYTICDCGQVRIVAARHTHVALENGGQNGRLAIARNFSQFISAIKSQC